MISVHFLHVHIGMLHRVLLTRRSTVFFKLPSFVDFQPIIWIELFESGYEAFLIRIGANLLKNSCDLVFLSAYEAAHYEHLINVRLMQL